MKSCTLAMEALLGPNGPSQLYRAHCYKVELLDGTVLRYTTWPKALTLDGDLYLPGPPLFSSSKVTQKTGTEVSTMTLTVLDTADEPVIGTIPIIPAIKAGLLTKATVTQYKVFMSTPGDTTPGALIWFVGRVSTVEKLGRSKVDMTVRSLMEILQNKIPNILIQASCSRTLFDGGCLLSRAAFKVSSAAQPGSTQNKIVATLVNPDGYFTQGVIEFKTGLNAGAKREVRAHAAGDLYLTVKLANVVNAGDTFDVYPGCDKTQATCNTKFANLVHFQGEPYVPVPETAL